MSLFNVGRLCLKVAGRDAGKHCVVVQEIDDRFVVVDGGTRRRKVNVRHLEPLADTLALASQADHAVVEKLFKERGLAVWNKKAKSAGERPRQKRKAHAKAAAKPKAKSAKKTEAAPAAKAAEQKA